MSVKNDLLPSGHGIRQAVRWIAAERDVRPEAKLYQLVDEASLRFDLTPQESTYLLEALRDPTPPESA